jgi:hypothetical protein
MLTEGGAGRLRPIQTRWCLATLVLLCGLVYGQTATFGFVQLDDQEYVTDNVHVQAGLTWDGINWAFRPTAYGANWIPLVWLSLMVDVEVWGQFAGGFHVTNVILHALNTSLLYVFLRRTTGRTPESLLAAALFCVHPLHVESVAWVSERKDVLSTFFGLLALRFYASYTENRSYRCYAASWLALLASLLSKQMLVTLPVLMLLLDWWPLHRLKRSIDEINPGTPTRWLQPLVMEKLPFLVLSVVCSAVAIWAQTSGGASQGLERYPLSVRFGNAAVSYALYLRKLFWPFDLAAYYPLVPPTATATAIALLVIGGITLAAWRCRRSQPALLFGWTWYVVSLLPVIGIIQVGEQALADRYSYVPMIGIYVALVWTASATFSAVQLPRPVRWTIAVLTVSAAAFLGFRQCRLWESTERLFLHTLAVTQDNWFAETAVGGLQMVDAGRVSEAEARFRKSIALNPQYSLSHYYLALLLSDRGELTEANAEFRRAIELTPQSLDARMYLCLNLQRLGADEELQLELARTEAEVSDIPEDIRRILRRLRSGSTSSL